MEMKWKYWTASCSNYAGGCLIWSGLACIIIMYKLLHFSTGLTNILQNWVLVSTIQLLKSMVEVNAIDTTHTVSLQNN